MRVKRTLRSSVALTVSLFLQLFAVGCSSFVRRVVRVATVCAFVQRILRLSVALTVFFFSRWVVVGYSTLARRVLFITLFLLLLDWLFVARVCVERDLRSTQAPTVRLFLGSVWSRCVVRRFVAENRFTLHVRVQRNLRSSLAPTVPFFIAVVRGCPFAC